MRAELSLLQHDFAAALIDVDLVQPALSMFAGDPALNIERFAQYRGSIIGLWQQTLANAFPVLRQLVGDDFFDNMARVYGENHPSQSGNLAEYGHLLPQFIENLENCRAYPYLGDVARLEWAVHRAYYSAHQAASTLAELAGFPQENLADVCFQFQPCCTLLRSPWAIADVWTAHQENDITLPHELAQTNACLIWRPNSGINWRVQVTKLAPAIYAALTSLSGGNNLGQALQSGLEHDPDFQIQSALADWFEMQIFCQLSLTHVPQSL